MAADPALEAFLALPATGADDAVAAYADARAEALGLALSAACRPGVIENLALLRRQAATFADASDRSPPPEAFEP
jgi:hypothetical protein